MSTEKVQKCMRCFIHFTVCLFGVICFFVACRVERVARFSKYSQGTLNGSYRLFNTEFYFFIIINVTERIQIEIMSTEKVQKFMRSLIHLAVCLFVS